MSTVVMENSINFRRQILEALLRTRQEMFPKPELCRSTCQTQPNQDDVDIEVGIVFRSYSKSYSKIEWEQDEPELEIEKLDV